MAPSRIVDSHIHLWDPGVLEYPWLSGLAALRHPFVPADLRAAAAAVPVQRVVFVEANARPEQALQEVLFAEAAPEVAGIVAFGGLDEPSTLASRLDELAARPRVKGIRHNIQGHEPGFGLRPFFVDGVREVGRRGLSFDLCATHDQLAEVAELCRRRPDTRLVLDHCGKPAIRAREREPWASHVAEIASMEHVWCKLSGLLTEAATGWSEEDLLPYAEHVVASFGPARLMFGSDWPVLTLAGDYDAWYRFTLRLTRDWSARDTAAFYHDNAESFYHL
jgi:L-fuconolactonase